MRKINYHIFLIFFFPSMLILIALFAFPLGQMFIDSFSTEGESFLENYNKLFNMEEFWIAVKNLLVFTFISILGHLVIGLIIASLLNIPIRGQKFFRSISLLPWMLPPAVVATTWAWMYHMPFGIVNPLLQSLGLISQPIAWLSTVETAMPALIVANLWRGYPFVSIILLAGLQSIPRTIYEASEIDGAQNWQSFLYITLPLLKKTISIALILDLIGTVKYFDLIWVMTQGGPARATEVLSTLIYKIFFMALEPGIAAALGVVMLFFLAIFIIFYIRFAFSQNE